MAVKAVKLVAPILLTDSLVTLHTTAANTIDKVYSITLCNTSATVTTGVDFHIVDSGGSAGPLNQMFSDGPNGINMAPGETVQIGGEYRMTAGDFIQAKAETTGIVSIRVDGDTTS